MAAIALLAAACGGGGDDGDAATPSATPAPPGLPNAYLRTNDGGFVRSVPGTHCWDSRCVDMAGPLTNLEPVALKPGEGVAVSFEAGLPDEWTLTWIPAPGQAPAPEEGVRAWVALDVPAVPTTGTTAPAAPGRYVAVIFARWDGQGDISYGVYAEVS